MKWWRAAGAVAVVAAAVVWACGGGSGSESIGTGPDAGIPDAGPPDAGPPDAGPPDGGPPDAGPPDGSSGFVPPDPIAFPSVPGWSFLGPQNGGPHDVFQVSADQGGNIWVAGGPDGLFVLRPGATKFQRFTIADGLHPYGYLNGDQAKFLGVPNGSPADPNPSLTATPVIAVEGGPPGVVFVGYQGKDYLGKDGCENNWDTDHKPGPLFGDPSIYKSGDADRVTLKANGTLSVVHYDIFSGPNVVPPEPQGREKLCAIFRIVWNPSTNDLWFGGNHGFAWGDPNYAGNPTCDGQYACSGVVEHSHPAFNGCTGENTCPTWAWITEDYRGISVDPSGDVWFGGAARTTKFHWSRFSGSPASRFNSAAEWTEQQSGNCDTAPCYVNDRVDVWPDLAPESPSTAPYGGERIDDLVFGAVAMPDGTGVWVGSGYLGLRRLDKNGVRIDEASRRVSSTYAYTHSFTNPSTGKLETATYPAAYVGAVALDTLDGKTMWVGNRYGGGLDRLDLSNPNNDRHYAFAMFGILANSGIEDIQMMGSGSSRKALVGFRQKGNTAGFVAIYSGP
jgi:hypothetical protein